MADTKAGFFARLGRYYRTLALIVFNTILLLLLINLAVDGIFDLQEYIKKKTVTPAAQYGHKEYDETLAKVYPGRNKEQIDKLIKETRRVELGYDYFTQFKEKPYKSENVNVDELGFRPIGDQGPWPPKEEDFVVFVFGGSTTFGYGVSDDQTIPSRLQEMFDTRPELNGRVYNFGRCSYISVQERILLEKLIVAGHVPDLAIFIDGLNEFAHFDGIPSYTKDLTRFMNQGDTPAVYKLIRELPVTRAVLSFIKEKAADDSLKTDPDEIVQSLTRLDTLGSRAPPAVFGSVPTDSYCSR
ncbi:SGNH/GDSL hydrolase family protein, partial [Thermodesulfobacteriota bacterium]